MYNPRGCAEISCVSASDLRPPALPSLPSLTCECGALQRRRRRGGVRERKEARLRLGRKCPGSLFTMWRGIDPVGVWGWEQSVRWGPCWEAAGQGVSGPASWEELMTDLFFCLFFLFFSFFSFWRKRDWELDCLMLDCLIDRSIDWS